MNTLKYTLLSDGSSDQALCGILTWVLQEQMKDWAIQPAWADLRRLRHPPSKLEEKIRVAIELYPCDILFIHRDAERANPETRLKEIETAVNEVKDRGTARVVRVVPVRMLEAWLLIDPRAIRRAAGNPNGVGDLRIPDLRNLEKLPNPKAILHDLLRRASELHGRRAKSFNATKAVHNIPKFVENFTPLHCLSAFVRFEGEIKGVTRALIRDTGKESQGGQT